MLLVRLSVFILAFQILTISAAWADKSGGMQTNPSFTGSHNQGVMPDHYLGPIDSTDATPVEHPGSQTHFADTCAGALKRALDDSLQAAEKCSEFGAGSPDCTIESAKASARMIRYGALCGTGL